MNRRATDVTISPLDATAAEALARLLAPVWAEMPYSATVTPALVRAEILTLDPPVIYPVRWQEQLHLGAWQGGELTGFLDAATGFDRENIDLPDYRPLGLIRTLILPPDAQPAATVAAALLDAVQSFWRKTGVAYVKAFHLSTGYPAFQAGAGILPGQWGNQVRALTGAEFLFQDRYYCYARRLAEPMEEVTPFADLNLVYRGDWLTRRYEVYHRRVERVAWADMARMTLMGEEGPYAIAKIVDIQVDPQWRRQDIAKWLTRRMINDATHLGDTQIVVHLAQHRHAAINLLVQQGFQELSDRGYTLEKALTQ